jgi:hypothetical protein
MRRCATFSEPSAICGTEPGFTVQLWEWTGDGATTLQLIGTGGDIRCVVPS